VANNNQAQIEGLLCEMLGRIADPSTLKVIGALDGESMRFSRLRERLPDVAPKQLANILRQMERDGLITRHLHALVPPRVDYELTPLGTSLADAVCRVWVWAEKHIGDMATARRYVGREIKAPAAPLRIVNNQ
jgi:DNA-binding HxlR family transcriptional regulator